MSDSAGQAGTPTCWWHPDRPTGLRCTRCERYACPECLRDASVGYHCIDCVESARKQQRAQQAGHRRSGLGYRTVAGARASGQVIVTPVLIALNVLVFVVTAAQARSVMRNDASALFDSWSEVPMVVAAGEWWRLFTGGFLHFGLIHLAMNMLALWFLGRELEPLLGKVRYIGLYGLSLFGGGAAVYAGSATNIPTAGASGAVYGLLGGILVAVLRLKLHYGFIVGIILLNFVMTLQFGFSLMGHLGGFVVGVLLTAALVYAPARSRLPVQLGTAVAIAVTLLALVLARDAQFGETRCTEPPEVRCGWTGSAT